MEALTVRRRPVRRRTRRRLSVAGGLAVLLLALGLRLPHLAARSLWFDEAFSWRLIQFFPSGEFFSRAAADVHPVLYYLLLWVWMLPARLVTSATPGTALADPGVTLLWMRLLSVVFGVATVAAMMAAGRVLFRSAATGLSAGLLTAVSAFQVQYAWEARMYTLGTALLPLALLGLVRTAQAPTARRAWRAGLRFGVVLGILLHVHYYALFSWLAIGAAKLLYFLRRMARGVSPVLRAPQFRAAEAGFWLSALLFLPWVPVFLSQAVRVEQAYWIPRLAPWSVPNTLARLFWGGAGDIAAPWAVGASVAAAVLLAVPLLRGRTFGDFVAASAFVGPFVLAVAVSLRPRSVYLDRYFLFASLGLLLLFARTLSLLPVRSLLRSRAPRWATLRSSALLLVTVLGILSVLRFWGELDFAGRPGARGAAAFLRETVTPGEPVVVSSSFVYFPIAFHLGCRFPEGRCPGGQRVGLYAETGEFGHFSGGPILVPEDLIGPGVFQSSLEKRLWVVDTTGFGGSRLTVPRGWTLAREERFREVFAYQGDIIVREYLPE